MATAGIYNICSKNSWKCFRKSVAAKFRSRKDFDDDQDSKKTEKYWKILRREVAVDRFMFDSAEFDHKVEAAFKIMKRSSEVREEALKWFESELEVERERVWRKLMREKNLDLSSAMPYLIKINQADAACRDMDDLSRGYVYEWQRRVNFTILEMFILRHKALPLSKRIKNTLFRKKK